MRFPYFSHAFTCLFVLFWQWESFKAVLGEPFGDPVVSGSYGGVHPFGPTLFYGYDGVIFEIIESQHIASVTLFRSSSSAAGR